MSTTKRGKQPEEKPIENMAVVEFAYSSCFALPHEAALQLVTALKGAEVVDLAYDGSINKLRSVQPRDVTLKLLNAEDYRHRKVELLLGGGNE